jgi:hypothetical protein
MPQGNTKIKQTDWTAKHTLTEQDLRQLVLEKIERAKLLQKANENRELNEFA